MVIPDGLHGTEEAITLNCTLDSLCAAPEATSTMCTAGTGECRHNPFLGQAIQVLGNECLDSVVQLVAVCGNVSTGMLEQAPRHNHRSKYDCTHA